MTKSSPITEPAATPARRGSHAMPATFVTACVAALAVAWMGGCGAGSAGLDDALRDGGDPPATADGAPPSAAGDAGQGDGGSSTRDVCPQVWGAPISLFADNLRLAFDGTSLHAVGTDGRGLLHRSSTDEGATWSAPTPIPNAGILPIYGPLVAEGSNVFVLTRVGSSLQLQRSTDRGTTWAAPVTLLGYPADASDRVQMDVEGGVLQIFVGRAGAVPDASFKVYYWRSSNGGQSLDNAGAARVLDGSTSAPPSPGGVAVGNGAAHIGYAGITPMKTLGHRARYMRSTDNGTTWSSPVDVSGPGDNPQIRPRPRALDGRVFVLWEEPLDHNQNAPYPNATRSDVRMNVSFDNGLTWQGPKAVTELPNDYVNHPEVAVGPGSLVHVVYRISVDQATTSTSDRLGYRVSADYGATWCPHETALTSAPPTERHPYNLAAGKTHVHLASAQGVYARRPL